jgi:glycine/D-amino acid oxidase-like deaminating enzyme
MLRERDLFDIAIIGAGFFGCELALELNRIGVDRIVLFEQEPGIMQRASRVNQARVHNGYHYPRALLTAERSRESFDRFLGEYEAAIYFGAQSIYAVAHGSQVSTTQFERFCNTIKAPCREASSIVDRLFDPGLIDGVFITREFTFNAAIIADSLLSALIRSPIDLRLNTPVSITQVSDDRITLATPRGDIGARHVINATYAALDGVGTPLVTSVKRELTELVLVEPPRELAPFAITVIDGPFFSLMPFPLAGLHSLSHVRYTPHHSWVDTISDSNHSSRSNARAMMRDSSRYVPTLAKSRIRGSLFELKAVLAAAEVNDRRPILVEESPMSPRIISILGAKIDNIYDARAYVRRRRWDK